MCALLLLFSMPAISMELPVYPRASSASSAASASATQPAGDVAAGSGSGSAVPVDFADFASGEWGWNVSEEDRSDSAGGARGRGWFDWLEWSGLLPRISNRGEFTRKMAWAIRIA